MQRPALRPRSVENFSKKFTTEEVFLEQNMKLIFLDETSDTDKKDYFGICCVLTDTYFYKGVKDSAQGILQKYGWNPDIEFKGSTLFSASRGDTKISVETRIQIATELLSLNLANKHARMKFAYCDFLTHDFKTDYLRYVPTLTSGVIPKATSGSEKDLLSIHYDKHSSISPPELRRAAKEIIIKMDIVFLRMSYRYHLVLRQQGFSSLI
jgi:hypothetical protein